MYIIKRDGTVVLFDKNKIINAINKAFIEVDGQLYENDTAIDIANDIEKWMMKCPDGSVEVEDIQDIIEDSLM
ncbi:MAG: ATP cone domain-containing protein [Mollicutes bacterium]|nr:ATP cone domain-containing protein [Mollicutes bacterium]